jgi:hypothetical protein
MIRFLHCDASQTPSLLVSYLDCFISSLGFGLVALKSGWRRVVVLAEGVVQHAGGAMWVAATPEVAPPQASTSAPCPDQVGGLADVDVIERRHGPVLVMYQVRSPSLAWRYCFLLWSVV